MPPLPKGVAPPKLVNRGGAGLLGRLPEELRPKQPEKPKSDEPKVYPVDKIAAELMHLAVPISSLTMDPDNARLHPERNLEAIKDSLAAYGQMHPIVVRKQTGIVVAGNGRIEAATAMGWTKMAAVFIEMTDVEAVGYGLADNRTAELAKWDFEVVARLDKLLLEAGQPTIGFSMDELSVLRAADWTPPAVSDGNGFLASGDDGALLVSFTPDQHAHVNAAVEAIRGMLGDADLDQADCITHICRSWLGEQVAEDTVTATAG